MRDDALRAGDVVEVRSAAEILDTLDDRGALQALPFMPEMVSYCGRRFVVDKRAEKVCFLTVSRRLRETVMLGDLRCDGSSHEGCQEECRLFWKESWLRRVGPEEPPPAVRADDGARSKLAELVERNTKQTMESDGRPAGTYRCQYTELYRASQGLAVWDPRAYLREYLSGNVHLGRFLRVTARAALEESLRALGLMPELPLRGTGTASVQEAPLNLQPGEWVQVKSKEEIAATLSPKGKHRGLWFDREMLPHCGKTYRVRKRVNRIIDYQTGRLVELKSDCVTLEGVVCSGDLSEGRWFCTRAIYPYWRECWLRRVSLEPTASQVDVSGSASPGPVYSEGGEPHR